MSYCQRCGEKNLPSAQVCENCGTALPPKDREQLQPGYGYDIHGVDCHHGLKLEPMSPGQKLTFLGEWKPIYCGNLLLILLEGLLLTTKLFRTENSLWQGFFEERCGLFGPNGSLFTCLTVLFLSVVLLIAANPLYTRNTFNPRQLLPAMMTEAFLMLLLCLTTWLDLYFGSFVKTTLTPYGFLLIGLCVGSIVVQCLLIRKYRQIKRSGVYDYVAN